MARKIRTAGGDNTAHILLANSTGAPLDPGNNGVIAISVWVNFINFTLNDTLISKGYDGSTTAWQLQVDGSSTTQINISSFGTGSGTFSATHGFTAGQWNHIYGDYDGTNWHLYFNGTSAGASSGQGGPRSNAQTTDVGNVNANGLFQRALQGSLADVAIWSSTLTPLEIKALSLGVRPFMVRKSSLIVWLPLDGIESVEPDIAGGAHNGTLVGTTTPVFSFGPPFTMFTPRWPQLATVPTPPPPVFILMPQIVT